MSRIEINTYHGFAWTILKSHGYLICAKQGVSLLLPAQARAHLAGLDGNARSARQRELFDTQGLIAFDLFPVLLTELFRAAPMLARAYARAYPLIIVDEFQDTNAEEWQMISQLGQHSRLIALGDPKQRIYDFKGAHPRRFDDFVAAFNPTPFDFAGRTIVVPARQSLSSPMTLSQENIRLPPMQAFLSRAIAVAASARSNRKSFAPSPGYAAIRNGPWRSSYPPTSWPSASLTTWPTRRMAYRHIRSTSW